MTIIIIIIIIIIIVTLVLTFLMLGRFTFTQKIPFRYKDEPL